MDRNEAEPIAKDLISKARELMKDVKTTVEDDFWAYTAFDKELKCKPEFCTVKIFVIRQKFTAYILIRFTAFI